VFLVLWAICSLIGNIGIFAIVALDMNGSFLPMIPAIFVGFGVGGCWVAVAQILIDDAGYKHYGKIWGVTILCNYIGIFVFSLLLYLLGITWVTSLGAVVVGIVGVVCAYLGL
jgi:hypothetical protein